MIRYSNFSDRSQIQNKSPVEILKDRILSALWWHNKDLPVFLSKLLTKLAELRTLNDTYSKYFLTLASTAGPFPSSEENITFTNPNFGNDTKQFVLTCLDNRKMAVV